MQDRSRNQKPHSQGTNKKVPGIIQITRRGTGYVLWENHEDIEIENENLGGALNGDEVEVEVLGMKLPSGRKALTSKIRPHGKVLRVIKRARDEFVCTLKMNAGRLMAVPDDARFYRPIQIEKLPDSGAAPRSDLRSGSQGPTLPAASGDKVLVRLLSFDGISDPAGELISVVGKAGEHRAEMNAIVLEHGFATSFPEAVAAEAREIEKKHAKIIEEEAKNAVQPDSIRSDLGNPAPAREDFRDSTTFTIDPKTAKDFDDALSVRELPGGEYEIGIHIADVSFFVRPGSALDEEAIKRGTSVYLVDATIPMLPEELSGNVCSLRQGEDRLAFSAIFRMNKNAEVLERRFARTIIRSDKRFTYEEAQDVLDERDRKSAAPRSDLNSNSQGRTLQAASFSTEKTVLKIDVEGRSPRTFSHELQILRNLSRTLRKNRAQAGAIDFGDNEFSFELDADGKPIAIRRKERIETNLLIEEFMLLANREVAAFVATKAKDVPESKLAFVYRIHDEPKEDRIEELATFVRAVGYDFGRTSKAGKPRSDLRSGSQGPTLVSAHDIQKLLRDISGTPEEQLIRTATLRSMAKAIYSTKNIGHFGLAFEFYTHFTSPIRRYPDVLVHRLLASHLGNGSIVREEYAQLEKLCLAASEQEARAADAERESVRYKQVEFMQDKVGQEFDGTISGVTEWGVYVEEKETGAEGLVRVASIKDDYYTHAPKSYALVGSRKGKKYALGDRVRVKLVSADLASRQMEFVLA